MSFGNRNAENISVRIALAYILSYNRLYPTKERKIRSVVSIEEVQRRKR